MADEIYTIPGILRYRSEHEGDRIVFKFYDKNGIHSTLTPREINTLAGKFASCLRTWGFQPGDVIANGLPNSPERLITDFGVILAGCILTNCQVIEKDGSDFFNSAQLSQCKCVIVSQRTNNSVYTLFSQYLTKNQNCSTIHNISLDKAPSLQKIILCDRQTNNDQHNLLERLKNDHIDILQEDYPPSSLAVLFATSGSTGFSKLIPESHERIIKKGRMFSRRTASPILHFIDGPIGLFGGFPFDYLTFGYTRVLQDKLNNQDATSPGELWDVITTAGCDGATFLPTDLYQLIDHFKHNPPGYKLHFIGTGGQPMKKELMDVVGLLCGTIVVSYGSSECGVMAKGRINEPSQFTDFYCGQVLPDVQMKIVDERGVDVDFGQEGNIYTKCDRLLKEYYNESGDQTKSICPFTQDGWFKTGDRGILHSDKSLFCLGRNGDVISFGSILVYLSWPEDILNKCKGILNAGLVCIQEDKNGDVKLYACVVLKKEHDSLTERKVCDYFNGVMTHDNSSLNLTLSRAFIMDALPLLPSGKVNKTRLRKYVMDEIQP